MLNPETITILNLVPKWEFVFTFTLQFLNMNRKIINVSICYEILTQ